MLGSQFIDGHEHGVVDGTGVVQEGTAHLLDEGGVLGVQGRRVVVSRGVLDLRAIDGFGPAVGACWGRVMAA